MRGDNKRIAAGIGAAARILLGLLAVGTSPISAAKEDPKWTIGVHYGGDVLKDLDDDADTASIYLRRRVVTPQWLASWAPQGTALHIDATASHLEVADDDAGQLVIGPVLVWRAPEGAWRLAGGLQPTLVSDHNSGDRDLGGTFQFTSHLGAGIDLGERVVVELQWRHTSNAELYDANDGIDIQILNLGWRL